MKSRTSGRSTSYRLRGRPRAAPAARGRRGQCRARLGHALEGGDERAALGGGERRQGAGQALGVEHRVGRHALGARGA